MKRNFWKENIKKYLIITIAAFGYATAVSLFVDPNNMAPGGVTGIAIIINRVIPVETGTLIFLLNIPILLFAIWKFGMKFTISTIYALSLISVFTNILSYFHAATDDILLAALAGGALTAVSIGLILKAGATTGGMDIIVKWLRLKLPHLKTGVIFFFADVIIVSISGLVFHDIEAALYAAIAVIVSSMVLDVVLYGKDEAKLLYIISDKPEEITKRILEELCIEGQGAFSGKEKRVLMCAVKKSISPQIETIVKEEDAEAFMIITRATEVFGEGYKSYFSERI